jgi:hypothetical protein
MNVRGLTARRPASWGHASAAVPPPLRARYRLDHDYADWKEPYDPARGPARVPPPHRRPAPPPTHHQTDPLR